MATGTIKNIKELKVKLKSQSCTLAANEHKSFTIPYGETINTVVAVLLMNTNNEAWVFGNVKNFDANNAYIGMGNTYNGSITADVTIAVFYYV